MGLGAGFVFFSREGAWKSLGPKNDPPPPAVLLGRAERRTHPLSSFCLVGQSGPRRARLLAVNWRRKKTAFRGAPFSRRAMRSAQFPAQPQKKAPKFASQSIMAQVLFTWKRRRRFVPSDDERKRARGLRCDADYGRTRASQSRLFSQAMAEAPAEGFRGHAHAR